MENSQLEIIDTRIEGHPKGSCCSLAYWVGGAVFGVVLTILVGTAFWLGKQSASLSSEKSDNASLNGIPSNRLHPDFLSATSTHGGSNLAVCTAAVGDDAEGFFSLDFNTGDLRGWVYYPRQGAFGGMFRTNVVPQLGQSKNPEYLLVSGYTAPARIAGNVKLAQSLIYVVDTRSGYFAAYTAPWNSSLESSAGAPQGGQMIFVSGGQIRESNAGVKKPVAPAPVPANPGAAAKNPGGAEPADPNKKPK